MESSQRVGISRLDKIEALFNDFYQAINGFPPYRWQRRLVRYLVENGSWPDQLNGPTGSGKTVVIEVHVFLNYLAGEMDAPMSVPRRMVIAVNRRSLVDSQYLHALEIGEKLRRAYLDDLDNGDSRWESGVLKRVADGLARRWGASGQELVGRLGPLIVTSMRGGVDARHPDVTWRTCPEAPMVICATPDMVGSRLLFRGYGVSRSMRPVEAGLLACDAVLVVDEAHLNRQLVKTARRISELELNAGVCRRQLTAGVMQPTGGVQLVEPPGTDASSVEAPAGVVALPLQVVESTATPVEHDDDGSPFSHIDVSREDVASGSDEVLARRITKPKQVELRKVEGGSRYADRIVGMALDIAKERGGVTVIIVNTVQTAVEVEGGLKKYLAGYDGDAPELACILGRMRPYDRESELEKLSEMRLSDRAGFIVGTQALEVGLNYDCHSMLTELSPASALVQRLGRVNRFGRYDNGLVIVVDSEKATPSPYEGEDLNAARDWVRGVIERYPKGVSALDLAGVKVPPQSGRRELFQLLETSDAEFFSHSSECLAAEEGGQTFIEETASRGGTADGGNVAGASVADKRNVAGLELWLRDELGEDDTGDVSLAVRDGLPQDPVVAADLLSRIPPLASELFPCSYSGLRGVMDTCLGTRDQKIGERRSGEGSQPPNLSAQADSKRKFMMLASEDGRHFHEMLPDEPIVPGGVYVVDASAPVFRGPVVAPRRWRGGLGSQKDVYEELALSDAAGDVPLILSDGVLRWACEGDGDLGKLAQDSTQRLRADVAETINNPDADRTTLEVVEQFSTQMLGQIPQGSRLQRLLSNLEAVALPESDICEAKEVVLIYRPDINGADVSRLEIGGAREVLLKDHEKATAELAGEIARSVRLSPAYVEAIKFAGAHHDDGKADSRFQRMLAGGKKPVRELAKSKHRSRSEAIRLSRSLGLSGWRHEQLSAAITWDLLQGFGSQGRGGTLAQDENQAFSPEMRMLVTRLVGTSHGRGRSAFDLGPRELRGSDPLSDAHANAIDTLYGTGLWEDLVADTDHEFGYWGTAYLEAVLRAADARESALEQDGQGSDRQ